MDNLNDHDPITVIEFCAGYGGLGLGIKGVLGERMRLIGLCELEGFAQANLISKMEAGLMEQVPIWSNLLTFPYRKFRGLVDIAAAGIPCQPHSLAGKRSGGGDQRFLLTTGCVDLSKCNQEQFLLRTSKDSSQAKCQMELFASNGQSKDWKQWGIKLRQEYSQRVKLAHLTNANESLSWPTANARDYKDGDQQCNQRQIDAGHQITLGRAATCWPTPTTAEAGKISNQPNYGQVGLSNHPAIRGEMNREKLKKDRLNQEKQWPTPTALEAQDQGTNWECLARLDKGGRILRRIASLAQSGQAAPANPSTDGSRQGLWPTVTAHTPDMESSGPNGHSGTYLAGAVKAWATPIMGDSHLASTPEVAQKRIEEGKVTLSRQNPGKLNPRWVETLMGLPVGWVMPSCASPVTIEPTNCACSATELCQQPQP